jgi:hypothetical protein
MNYLPLITSVLAVISLLMASAALGYILSTRKTHKLFFAGKNAAQLEDFILNQNKKINDLAKQAEYIEESLKNLYDQQKLAVQKVGLIRYNSYADDGGNLSFSIALLDAASNGVVITSLHGRAQNRIYTKPISKGTSEITLTKEEKEAITSSKNLNQLS